MGVVWAIIGAVVILALLSGGSKSKRSGTIRIDHPHVIDDDDYECSVLQMSSTFLHDLVRSF